MAREKIIAFDVDGVVVDSAIEWYKYLRAMVKHEDIKYEDVNHDYNFYNPFSKYLTEEECAYFWKQENLYDRMVPMDGAVAAVNAFKTQGFKILFVSHVEGNHSKSKYEFLKRNFPMDGFFATREKGFIRTNIAVDDRLNHLVGHPEQVTTVQFLTPQFQYLTDFSPDVIIDKWNDAHVDEILTKWEEKSHAFY